MTRRTLALLVALLTLLALLPGNARAAQRPPGAVLRGQVTGADGSPVARAEIEVWRRVDGRWALVRSATADERGRYRIGGLRERQVWLRFDAEQYADPQPWAPEWWRDAPTREEARSTALRPGRTVVRDAALGAAAHLTGRLTVPGGGPAAGVRVGAYAVGSQAQAGETTSAADGTYDVSGLAAGRYVLHFQAYDFDGLGVAPEWYGDRVDRPGATVVEVGAAATVTGLDDELPAEARIGTTWRTSTGKPVRDLPVVLYRQRPDGRWREQATDYAFTTDPSFAGLPAGRYRLFFYRDDRETGFWWPAAPELQRATDVVLAAGEDRTIAATSAVGASISGRITGRRGRPLDGASVLAYRRDRAGTWVPVPTYDPDSEIGPRALEQSGADGRYAIGGLLPGRYRIQFVRYYRLPGEWWRGTTRSHARTIVVTERARVRGIDASLGR